MARSGLYKSEVKKARDALLAQNKHPSVDAVRVELGNTGSKTTIHKYLRELDEEEGDGGRKASVSEAVQDLVARLAGQLQDDANIQIDAIRTAMTDKEREHNKEIVALHNDLKSTKERLELAEQKLVVESAEHVGTRDALNQEAIALQVARQEVSGLKAHLHENEAHLASIEEKHQHAREALEHYRQSVKEHREQDQRRHEQQVQHLQTEMRQLQQGLVIKQDEVTRLNQDCARLVSELSHSEKALYDEKSRVRQLEIESAKLVAAEYRLKDLEGRIENRTFEANKLRGQLSAASARVSELSAQVHALQIDAATSLAALEVHQSSASELRTLIEAQRLHAAKAGPASNDQALVQGKT